jgi:hydroxyacylglutathione hydrolase
MIFRRFLDPKLAQTSYLIGCPITQEAIVVDPNRRIGRYLEAAAQEGLRISHVTETHIHADFLSGSRELANRTGARLYLSGAAGPEWEYHYAAEAGATILRDGDRLSVGRIELRVLHVPGHTPEHLAFLVTDQDRAGEPMGVLTGDFIFVGDVGRPDLLERAVGSAGTMEQSARQLFRSIQRFHDLSDYLQIWPGHGAGSACGKSLSAVPQSTLGYEKRFNWAFGVSEEAAFVRAVLTGQPDPPRYFAEMKRINQAGPRARGATGPSRRLPLPALTAALAAGGAVVDTRPAAEYAAGAIPGTINIPGTRAFTTWAGSLLPYGEEFHLIVGESDEHRVEELVDDLAGIGLDQVGGYFGSDVIADWRESHGRLQTIPQATLDEMRTGSRNGNLVLDVRTKGEWEAGHVPGSVNMPIGELGQRLQEIPRTLPLTVHCQTGLRAAIAASLLRAAGFDQVRLFAGGFAQWRAAGQPIAI